MKAEDNIVFKRYAPFIQEFIYKKGWNQLYDVQLEACGAILDSNLDIILASGTATGKTEAVFFPILTDLERNPSKSISVLYIGPLKALINDQFKRLSELLENSEYPLWPWHGDISYSLKEKAKKIKKGIIQITPESLEALLINHPDIISELFTDLRFIIIDEIHSLMGSDRGLQVMCQIERIERLSKNRPRRIGLSATLGNYNQAKYFLSSGHPEKVVSLGNNSMAQSIGLRVDSFLSPYNAANPKPMESLDYLYDRTRSNKSIIFTNSRKEAESVIASLKKKAKLNKSKNIYHIHHGSLSAELRRETENKLKYSSDPIVTAATLTLELGIDIGTLDQTIQIGAPFSCSNFVQRLGRSGRISGKPLMRFINFYNDYDINSPQDIPWDLLRSIAIIELYISEKWIEPFSFKEKPYSLLIHQTLSILASYKELKPNELARFVLTLFPFKNQITQEEYKEILRELINNDYIQQLEDESLILGLSGAKLVNHYSFYAVFNDSEDFKVVHKGHEIGTLSQEPSMGEMFSLGGNSWKVVSINKVTKIIEVVTVPNAQAPQWNSSGIEMNNRILAKVSEILKDNKIYTYLSEDAKFILEKARIYAQGSGMLSGFIVDSENEGIYIFPWSGTKEIRTLGLMFKYTFNHWLKIKRINVNQDYIYLQSNLPSNILIEKIRQLPLDYFDLEDLSYKVPNPIIDKFDALLPENLRRKGFLKNKLDIEGALSILKEWKDSYSGISKKSRFYPLRIVK